MTNNLDATSNEGRKALTFKKFKNRNLYNFETRRYVDLERAADLIIANGGEFEAEGFRPEELLLQILAYRETTPKLSHHNGHKAFLTRIIRGGGLCAYVRKLEARGAKSAN